ncbi:unnamed protein product [Urochloa humidicola]
MDRAICNGRTGSLDHPPPHVPLSVSAQYPTDAWRSFVAGPHTGRSGFPLLTGRLSSGALRSRRASATPSANASSKADASLPPENPRGQTQQELLPRDEVRRSPRVLRQPATLFGDDHAVRLCYFDDVLEEPAALADAEEIFPDYVVDVLRDDSVGYVRADIHRIRTQE